MDPCYLCVLDFEATCWNDNKFRIQEIIEFPSILYKFDEKPTFISEFSKYVKPTCEPILSNFCTELTGIIQSTVDSADKINIVYEQHYEWLLENTNQFDLPVYIITVGHWDLLTMLPIERKNKRLRQYDVYTSYINIKDDFKQFYKHKSGSLPEMLQYLGLSLDGRHHSGIDDTRNTAKIVIKMINDGCKSFKINKI